MDTLMDTDASFIDPDTLNASAVLTSADLIAALKDVWRNERIAPELLPHREDLVEILLDQIRTMERNVEAAKAKDPYRCHCHKMELNRVRYMLSNYLRCRLEKLETYSLHYKKLSADERNRMMTPAEGKFLDSTQSDTEALIVDSLKANLPPNIDVLDAWRNAPLRPRLDAFVFVRPKEDIAGIILDQSQAPETILAGKQYMLRYSSVRKYVVENLVTLM